MNFKTVRIAADNAIKTVTGNCSVSFIDLDSKKRFVINDVRFRSASLIKVFIMGEVFRQRQCGVVSFSETLCLKNEYCVGGAGTLSSQAIGTKVDIGELVELMITRSDNAATNMLIDKLGMRHINQFIKNCGADNTVLQRKMMDWNAIERGFQNYTSTFDMVGVLESIFMRRLVDEQSSAEMLAILSRQTDRSGIARGLGKEYFFAGKSGELDNLNADCGIVKYRDRKCAMCIICESVADNAYGQDAVNRIAAVALRRFLYE